MQQAALTGESLPIEKEAIDAAQSDRTLADSAGVVLLCTSVVSGLATAVIVAEEITATYEHGVLTLHIPKAEVPRARQIPVQVKEPAPVH